MTRHVIACLAFAAMLAACGVEDPEPVHVADDMKGADLPEAPVPEEALEETPEVVEEQPDLDEECEADHAELLRRRRGLPPVPLAPSESWRRMSIPERERALRRMDLRGSDWARETLRRMGTMDNDEMAELGEEFEREVRSVPSTQPSTTSYSGDRHPRSASMPFGRSSFGPWDTGDRGYAP